ncbi:MAG: AAA family ATPase, partial [Candidatus Eremiobacteraeota bacterium]|nr:AAA family ATPase [Candidatus Eremiobacteraeota bacterium]
MRTLTIRLFGGAHFADGDRPISLVALPKSLPLLGYLLLNAGRAVPRDRLAYALWPDETESDARSNLRRHLYRLVRALPPASPGGPWILTDAKTVRWNTDSSFACDVVSFEALSADPSTREAAAALYTGDVLAGLDEPWLPAERERLGALQDVNLAHAIANNHERRDYPAAIAFAQMRLALDPFDERSVRALMTLRSEAGDRSGALAEYEGFAETLYDELGARPMPETSVLCDRISAGEALARNPAAAPAQERASDRLPFVGRDRDLGELETAWSAATRGRGGAVLIGGEAGIGKSRLVGEFARVVEAQGGSVFFGTTAPEETRPYQAVAEALRDALPVLLDADIEPLWLSTLAALVPEIAARRPELDRPPALDERKDRARLFEAVARAIEACARTRPRLIVLEDLHWASGATLELVEYLARRSSSMRALFALTARDDLARSHPLQRILRDLTRAEIARTIPLRPLSREDVMTLLARRGETDAEATSAAVWLYARTEGNPLFLRLALGTEAAEAFDGGIDAVIATRFAGVGEDARALAEAAAIVGQGFDVEIVREVCGWTQAAVHDALDELIDRQMIREATVSQHTDYAFSHHLLWLHVYGAIPADRRARGHRRAARALDDTAAGRPELARSVARHYDAAGIPDRAAVHYGRAAEHAARLCANDDAIAAATRAFELAAD